MGWFFLYDVVAVYTHYRPRRRMILATIIVVISIIIAVLMANRVPGQERKEIDERK